MGGEGERDHIGGGEEAAICSLRAKSKIPKGGPVGAMWSERIDEHKNILKFNINSCFCCPLLPF